MTDKRLELEHKTMADLLQWIILAESLDDVKMSVHDRLVKLNTLTDAELLEYVERTNWLREKWEGESTTTDQSTSIRGELVENIFPTDSDSKFIH